MAAVITQYFTGRVLFLTPNQQCQSNEDWKTWKTGTKMETMKLVVVVVVVVVAGAAGAAAAAVAVATVVVLVVVRYSTQCPLGRGLPSVPSFILIHPTIWQQYTNITDRTDRQTGQDRTGEPSIGRTILQAVAQKQYTNDHETYPDCFSRNYYYYYYYYIRLIAFFTRQPG